MNEKKIAEYTVTLMRRDNVLTDTVSYTGTHSELRVHKNHSGTHWCVCKDIIDEDGEERTEIHKYLVSRYYVILN